VDDLADIFVQLVASGARGGYSCSILQEQCRVDSPGTQSFRTKTLYLSEPRAAAKVRTDKLLQEL